MSSREQSERIWGMDQIRGITELYRSKNLRDEDDHDSQTSGGD